MGRMHQHWWGIWWQKLYFGGINDPHWKLWWLFITSQEKCSLNYCTFLVGFKNNCSCSKTLKTHKKLRTPIFEVRLLCVIWCGYIREWNGPVSSWNDPSICHPVRPTPVKTYSPIYKFNMTTDYLMSQFT